MRFRRKQPDTQPDYGDAADVAIGDELYDAAGIRMPL